MGRKNNGEDPAYRMHFSPLPFKCFQEGIGDKAIGEAKIDAEGEGNGDEGEERRDRLGVFAPADRFDL